MADWELATRDSNFIPDDLAIATCTQINSADGNIVEAEAPTKIGQHDKCTNYLKVGIKKTIIENKTKY